MSGKVDRLVREEEALAARLKSLRDARIREEKKRDLRRAEVVGTLVLKQVAEGELEASWLHSLLREGLTRRGDLALFELGDKGEDENALEPASTDDLKPLDDLDAERTPALSER